MFKNGLFSKLRVGRSRTASALVGASVTVATVVSCVALNCSLAVADDVTLIKDGVPQMSLVVGSVVEPADELRDYLKRITGAEFKLATPDKTARRIYVGLAADFPEKTFDSVATLGPEGFIIRSDHQNIYLIACRPLGIRHAVTTFLHELGCRWFFAGQTWEVIPRQKTIRGAWDLRQTPNFPVQRSIWPAYGQYAQNRRDWDAWNRHNRMGGPRSIVIHHTFNGLDPETDFEEHPQWFALVDGERRPSKPCYSHPDVLRRAVERAKKQATTGAEMVPMSAPDGLGFCECPRCLAVLKGAEPFRDRGALWGRDSDGVLVNVTSETLFRFVNHVAAAVAEEYPHLRIGCYAYSAYSHPPTFKMHPNVYIQTTTAYRRTPLSLDEQLAAWGTKTNSLGIREYYSVFQWDWEEPYPGKVRPDRLKHDLRFYHDRGVTAINAEASNNWGPRGLGYYLAAQLMWNLDADVIELVEDFYHKAFGPAAEAVERYYVRWYGAAVATRDHKLDVASDAPARDAKDPRTASLEQLRAAFLDLDEAARSVKGRPGYQQRVDHLRMYLHYLCLRQRLLQAEERNDREGILAAIQAETVFGGRLNDTNMTHARPLIGKAFLRRFRKYEALLATLPEENREAKLWRRLGTPPTPEELDRLWHEDMQFLGTAK